MVCWERGRRGTLATCGQCVEPPLPSSTICALPRCVLQQFFPPPLFFYSYFRLCVVFYESSLLAFEMLVRGGEGIPPRFILPFLVGNTLVVVVALGLGFRLNGEILSNQSRF